MKLQCKSPKTPFLERQMVIRESTSRSFVNLGGFPIHWKNLRVGAFSSTLEKRYRVFHILQNRMFGNPADLLGSEQGEAIEKQSVVVTEGNFVKAN